MLSINQSIVIELCHVFWDACEFYIWENGVPVAMKRAKRKVDNIGQYFMYQGKKCYISNFEMNKVFA